MAVVRLRAPLSELAGGRRERRLDGATVREVLRALESEHPAIAGSYASGSGFSLTRCLGLRRERAADRQPKDEVRLKPDPSAILDP